MFSRTSIGRNTQEMVGVSTEMSEAEVDSEKMTTR